MYAEKLESIQATIAINQTLIIVFYILGTFDLCKILYKILYKKISFFKKNVVHIKHTVPFYLHARCLRAFFIFTASQKRNS